MLNVEMSDSLSSSKNKTSKLYKTKKHKRSRKSKHNRNVGETVEGQCAQKREVGKNRGHKSSNVLKGLERENIPTDQQRGGSNGMGQKSGAKGQSGGGVTR